MARGSQHLRVSCSLPRPSPQVRPCRGRPEDRTERGFPMEGRDQAEPQHTGLQQTQGRGDACSSRSESSSPGQEGRVGLRVAREGFLRKSPARWL